MLFNRVIWIILDGVGAGALPDAQLYGDSGSNTLGNCSRAVLLQRGYPLQLPHLQSWGLGNITSIEGIQPIPPEKGPGKGEGAFGRAQEQSLGKDTTSGHWEMTGLVLKKAFTTFPQGFPQEIVHRWIQENSLLGVLGNKPASGTEIIQELGQEHLKTGQPILYTSADSVWQVAAHEEAFGLERLYSICQSARILCNELQIGRVIARPFIGNPDQGKAFQRTYHRKDYSIKPFAPMLLDLLADHQISTLGIGKISNIFAAQGVPSNIDTAGNTEGLRVLLEQMKKNPSGLIFCNLIDFDMLYGHRRNYLGFAEALEEFDRSIPLIKKNMNSKDLLLIASDHGNDPTFHGTDHTREYIPILAYTPAQKNPGPIDLGTRSSFGDLGATVYDALVGQAFPDSLAGTSFLNQLV